jgi:diguanylate cyclase (GGDEF)-like protein
MMARESKTTGETEKMRFSSKPGIAGYIICITVFFTLYEFLKSRFLPALTMWESHTISILVVTILSTITFLWFRTIVIRENRTKNQINENLLIEIHERRQTEKALQDREHLLRESQRIARIGSFILDLNTKVWEGTPETNELMGIDESYPHTLERLVDLIHPDSREVFQRRVAAAQAEKNTFTFEYKIISEKTREERWIQGYGGYKHDKTTDSESLIGIIVDVTERKSKDEENYYLSYHDQLTGLYNRRFYEEELLRLDTSRNLPMTIIMGDVNGLKLINDSFGHNAGDELLRKGAAAIKKCCRTDDIIARIGGDEFVMILPKIDADEAEEIIKRIRNSAAEEEVENIPVSISFGYETKRSMGESIVEVVKRAEDYMYKKKLFENQSLRGKTIRAIVAALYEKNSREEKHSKRVSELCEIMGAALGFPEYQIMELRTVGLFHDIGKIALNEDLLNKKGPYTDEEWNDMKRHPEIGFRILSTSNDLFELAEYVLAHHERWDGKGYPRRLAGTEIPLVSRIVAIVDAYDAMTAEGGYQEPCSDEEAAEGLNANAGVMFDPYLVDVFINRVIRRAV